MTTGRGIKTRAIDAVEHVTMLNCAQLADVLQGLTGGRFATFKSVTEPRLNKKNRIDGTPNTLGVVRKVSTAQVCWNVEYKKALDAARKRQGLDKREVKPRQWGCRIKGTPFVVHMKKGESTLSIYVEMYVIKSLGYVYLDAEGNEIDKDLVHQFITPRTKTEVTWRDYKIEGIVEIAADGRKYSVTPTFRLTADLLTKADTLLTAAKAAKEQAAKDKAALAATT